MGRKKSSKKNSNKPIFAKYTSVPNTNNQKKPNIGSSVKDGIGLGVGMGLGSQLANSTIDMLTNTSSDTSKLNQNYCDNLLIEFKECVQFNDANICKDKFNSYYKCINQL